MSEVELSEELHDLPEGSAVLLIGADGLPINAAFRTRDLEGELGWALGGILEPWTSDKLAAGIIAAKGAYKVVSE
jgi:hypothetical protein